MYKVTLLADGRWIVEDEHGTLIDGPFAHRVDAIRIAGELTEEMTSDDDGPADPEACPTCGGKPGDGLAAGCPDCIEAEALGDA
jgi:hypothetical protein